MAAPTTLLAMTLVMLPGLAQANGHRATFTVGLAAEYLGDSQQIGENTSRSSSLRTMLSMAVDGHLVDPRFLAFDATVLHSFADLELTDRPDTSIDETTYDAGIRLFSNRPVSVDVRAGRHSTDIDGIRQGSAVSGDSEYLEGGLALRRKEWLRFNLRHREYSFDPDDPATQRDETTRNTDLTARAVVGVTDAMLTGLWRRHELFGGRVRQELGSGRVDVDVNRAGPTYWHTDVVASSYRSAQDNAPFSPWTDNLLVSNAVRRWLRRQSFWEVRVEYQVIRFDSEKSTNAGGAVLGVAELGPSTLLEGEVAYLTSDPAAGPGFSQPSATVGLRTGRRLGPWSLAFNPRVTYVSVTSDQDDPESSVGASLAGSVRRDFRHGSITLEGEYYDNRLSIPAYDPGDLNGGRSFLAGLELERQRLRLGLEVQPTRRIGLFVEADVRRRVRLNRDLEVTEDVARGRVTFGLGTVQLSASADRVEVVGGDLPSVTSVFQGEVSWTPNPWLVLDALVRREERELMGFDGTYDFAEAGVRFRYAKLSLFARIRQENIDELGLERRRNRRVWAGILRTFDFGFGNGHL